MDDAAGDAKADDVIGADEASRILDVQPDRIQVLADQGLLTPVDDGQGGTGFARAEVEAARLQGG